MITHDLCNQEWNGMKCLNKAKQANSISIRLGVT